MNLIATVLLCSQLQQSMFSLYQVENGIITTPDYGVSEVCDFASKEGSEDLQNLCITFMNAGCEE